VTHSLKPHQAMAKRPSLLAQLVATRSVLAVEAVLRARDSSPKTIMTSLRLITVNSLSVTVSANQLDAEHHERCGNNGENDQDNASLHSGPTVKVTLAREEMSSAR
jgi:hypothetical protein